MHMRDDPEQATTCETALPEPANECPGRTDPSLSANLRADYEAVQNDLEQATELAAEFQRQLAGKSNEVAELKQLLRRLNGISCICKLASLLYDRSGIILPMMRCGLWLSSIG
jgi:hypothetical protein